MKSITVYDIEAERIEKICEEKDITAAELIEALIQIADSEEVDLDDWI